MTKNAGSKLFFGKAFAVTATVVAASVVAWTGLDFIQDQDRREMEPLLVSSMEKAITLGQSQIVSDHAHVFWLAGNDNGKAFSLRAEYNAARSNFCWGTDGAKEPVDCFKMKDASQEFVLAMMSGACKTADKTVQPQYRKKYCPRFMV